MSEAPPGTPAANGSVMAAAATQKVTREDVRRALSASGGDLRAVGKQLGLATREILMILAYDVTLTATGDALDPKKQAKER